MSLTKAKVQKINKDLNTLITGYLKDQGLTLDSIRGSYNSDEVTFKVKVLAGTKTEAKNKEWENFIRGCNEFKASDLNKTTFKQNGETFTIVGCSPRARKYPILAKSSKNGSTYKFAINSVLSKLGRETSQWYES